MDERWKALADKLVNYSTGVRPGDRVMIAMSEIETYPLAHAVYESAIKAGSYPQIQLLSESLRYAMMSHGNRQQIEWVPEIEAYGMEWADVYFGLRGGYNFDQFSGIPFDILAANQKAMGRVSTLRWQNTRWCLIRVPNPAFAEQAGADLETIQEMFFDACLMDYAGASQQWCSLASSLSGTERVRIVGLETDLQFSVAGRKWLIFDGKINMPDGEIYTAPVNETLNGQIYFDTPGVFGGKLIHDIRLEWTNGKLTHASASTNQDYLIRVIETDAGSSLLGEFALGMNPHLNRFCNDILFDEKIGGTIHIALGRAYPECGGTNKSDIHWDIVKDLRKEGAVYVDNRRILENGKVITQ